ncbi:MAG: InlB B-repeat-containing protein [Bacteroides sp.]|nr:InlB B-repeat-containing protein [Bacteroides sp.]
MFKKRLKCKTLGVLSMIVMTVCLTLFAGLRSKAWTVNPADYRYDMSLYFSLATPAYEDLSKYEIGAFINDECRGLAEKLDLPDGGSCLYMRIRSNVAAGEEVTFKLRDKDTGVENILKGPDGEAFQFKSDDMVGMPSSPYLLTPYFQITVSAGEHGKVEFENGLYAAGSVVKAKAVPDEGYHLESWSNGSTDAELSITVTGNLEITATFAVSTFKAVFTLDGEPFTTLDVEYGAAIEAPEAPAKEGHSFSGWQDLPATMPAHDIEINGVYVVNNYILTFKVENRLIGTAQVLPYGAPIVTPDAPSKEGHTFNGWGDVPATMPATNLEVIGTYTLNSYKVTFKIDGEVFKSEDVPYGTTLIAPEAPVREDYTFLGWEDVPATMPARDLEFDSTYELTTYKVYYMVDGEVVYTGKARPYEAFPLPQGDPVKEGHTFLSWGEGDGFPETMPEYNLEYNAEFTVNFYHLTFKYGDEVFYSGDVAYGSEINAPQGPEQEGHTFAWTNVPATMPAKDLDVTGSFSVNTYTVSYFIDGVLFKTIDEEYGTPVDAPEVEDKQGHTFSGWGNVPATMPANNLEINGTYAANYYLVSFKVDGSVVSEGQLAYGSPISVPAAPEKEGYTFSSWGNVPATVPACDVEFTGIYTPNNYKVTFKIGREVVYTGEIAYGTSIVAPEGPSKEGHTFIGWGMIPDTMPARDLTFTGSYEVNNYTVTFMLDEKIFFIARVPYGTNLTAPSVTEKVGHTFNGWSEMPATMPAYDLTLTGSYTVNHYKAVFKLDDEVFSTIEVPYGASIVLPDAPEKLGHTFMGWGMVPSTMPAQDIELVGAYDTNLYKLTFIIDGVELSSTQLAYGATIVAPSVADKEGHTFSGWGDVPETMPHYDLVLSGTYADIFYKLTFKVDGEVIFAGDLPFEDPIVAPEVPEKLGHTFSGWNEAVAATMPSHDVEYTGSYTPNNYKVVFKIGDEVISSEEVTFGNAIKVPEVETKVGYTFSGWGMVPETMPAQDLEFTGSYDINYHQVIFKIGDEVVSSYQVAYGGKIEVPYAEKEGYTFNGWSEIPETMPDHDVEITGSYTVNQYTVTFVINDEVIETLTVDYGSPIEAPEAPVKEGSTFSGWGEPATGVMPATMPARDIELTGSYTVNLYVLTFRADEEFVFTLELPYGSEIVMLPESPSKEGYTFNGWGEVPAKMPAHNLEIIGTYTVNYYKATFKVDDKVVSSSEVAYGTSLVAPEAPAKEGYTFSGWGDVPVTMPARDLEFTAAYEANSYNVVYKVDGEVVDSKKVKYGEEIPQIASPSKEGYTFSGWGEIPATMPAWDMEFNGSYSVNHYTVTFKIEGEEFLTAQLPYGSEIVLPEAPAKEGYTFRGWGEVPASMPARDLEFNGSYTNMMFTVTFSIDGVLFHSETLEFGAPLVAPEVPSQTGHNFSGWGEVPATMPAHDLAFMGTYADLFYTFSFKIDDEVISSGSLPYEATIVVPEAAAKEGHTFSGWGEVPATMPAYNIEFVGTYNVNYYMLTFKLGDEILLEAELPYGGEIAAPEAPAKEGYTFTGWGVVPATMPAGDLLISGEYEVNSYNISFNIDGVAIFATQLRYGTEIVAPEAPAKEGYTFTGWGEVPATMPANELVFSGSYNVNIYKVTFKIDDVELSTIEVPYGASIVLPDAPAKEGYTFMGWGMVPETMPAQDIEIVGTYDSNLYNITFNIDGVEFFATQLAYGATIVAPEAPVKPGQTFSGWGTVPATMPAYDLVINGTFADNFYKLTFKVGDEVVFEGEVAFEDPIVVPEVAEKEGYTFSGWGEVASIMPDHDLEYVGTYTPNVYTVVFKIGDEVVSTVKVAYGEAIELPEVEEKEGYTFSGWNMVPETMPARDLEFTASYDVNTYMVTFKVGDEVISALQLAYGEAIVAPEVAQKEGYTFSGWGEVPATMPARDLEINGTYNVNTYKVVYKVDGEVVSESNVAYGAELTALEMPEKEGYTFSGWGVVPPTMPATDLEFTGTYNVNYYNITFLVNGEVVQSLLLPYGAAVVAPEIPDGEDFTFDGWKDEIPETMPAHDVTINGTTTGVSSIDDILLDGNGNVETVTICNLNGVVLYKNVKADEVKERLAPGVYIINGRKAIVK